MNLTPVLEQWSRIKKKYPDSILLFRLGDFYETFYEDAKVASKVLGITLTKRQSGVPLAGIPHHAATHYIAKLTRAGIRVAICEQLEPPTPGKLVKRGVVEVITQGTILDDSLLETRKNNYLASISPDNNKYGLAFIDLSTGDFRLTELSQEELLDEIKKISPLEIIMPNSPEPDTNNLTQNITRREPYEFSYDFGFRELTNYFKVNSLDGFGCKNLKLGIGAAGAALAYLRDTKKHELPHIKRIIPYSLSDYLLIDEPTRKNLELTRKINGEEGEGTLLWVLDHTLTPMGARMLRDFINFPLTKPRKINSRLDRVEKFVDTPQLLQQLRELLSKIPDLERLIVKVSMERANARDLRVISSSLKILPQINSVISNDRTGVCPSQKGFKDYKLPEFSSTVDLIEQSITESPPPTLQEGRIIRSGFNKELDGLREITRSGKKWISDFEARERKRTHINSLKVGFNNVFGYYIEITRPNLKLVPKEYIRKQTLVNNERFITEELKKYESQVLGAEERIRRLEYELFCEIRKKVAVQTPNIQTAAHKLATLDVFASLAYVAKRNKYIRPELTTEDSIIIKDGRHPVVELLLSHGDFVPNPTTLDPEQKVYIITGPNMSGKSTYLRQLGLIVLMAQLGSYVPASYARIGVTDRIFTRIGASDDLARGVSTFLAEMNETANILNNASRRSLVLLDEIGRGTSTFDGMSIAWATTEYLLKHVKCKTIFATHYHELTELHSISSKIKNYQIGAKRYEDKIIFLHQLKPGGCDESYGIDVARLAGIPEEVIKRARSILGSLELKEQKASKIRTRSKQKTLFERQNVEKVSESPLQKELEKIDPDKITPIDALLLLKKLKSLSEKN